MNSTDLGQIFIHPKREEEQTVIGNRVRNVLLYSIMFAISMFIPLALLLLYRNHAIRAGISLETGCCGPELPFGLLSGILMAVQLRLLTTDSDLRD